MNIQYLLQKYYFVLKTTRISPMNKNTFLNIIIIIFITYQANQTSTYTMITWVALMHRH